MSRKYHNKEDIFDAISQDYAWRIHELSSVKEFAESAQGRFVHMAVRQGILMLYAHWEGFIKFSSVEYLQFIVDSGFRQCDLADNFLGIMLRKNYKGKCNTYAIRHHISVAHSLLNGDQMHVIFNPRDLIKTDSNLSYELFENILDTLAIDAKKYKTKCQQINESLLNRRNKIAHGEHDVPSREYFIDLFNDVTSIMYDFKTDLQNLCVSEGYKR